MARLRGGLALVDPGLPATAMIEIPISLVLLGDLLPLQRELARVSCGAHLSSLAAAVAWTASSPTALTGSMRG